MSSSWPAASLRLPSTERRALDLPALASLTFRAPSEERFPCLRLVKEAARAGGTQTAALSAADEIAVERFLSGEILYTDIPRLVSDTMHAAPYLPCDSLENILSADSFARDFASRWGV